MKIFDLNKKRYASDHAENGYRDYGQLKLLQCKNVSLAPQQSRIYPPSYLEWKATKKPGNMALDIKFSDSNEYTIKFK